MFNRVIIFIFLASFLTACEDGKHGGSDESSAPDIPPPGLIKNQLFESESAGRQNWVLTQHTGLPSYRFDTNNGVASIERIGAEPWGVLKQVFRHKETKAFQGKTMEFSADISSNFTDTHGKPFQPAGIGILVRGIPTGANPMHGVQTILNKTLPVNPDTGPIPWHRYAVEVKVPAPDEATFVEVELFFVMTSGGVMRVSGPAFVEIE